MTTKYLIFGFGTAFMLLSIKIPYKSLPDHQQISTSVPFHITQQQQDPAWSIYLTIDDGPSPASAYIDSVVQAEKAPINVFLVGANVSGNIFYRANPFIEIGNHSYTHADCHYRAYYRKAGKVLHDFEHNETTLGLSNKLARLPGRNTWRIQGRKQTDLIDANNAGDSLAVAGFHLLGWDLEWGFNARKDTIQPAALIMHRIEQSIAAKNSFTPGHLVILCHENMFENLHNKPELARLVRMINDKKEYRLQWLSKYPL